MGFCLAFFDVEGVAESWDDGCGGEVGFALEEWGGDGAEFGDFALFAGGATVVVLVALEGVIAPLVVPADEEHGDFEGGAFAYLEGFDDRVFGPAFLLDREDA